MSGKKEKDIPKSKGPQLALVKAPPRILSSPREIGALVKTHIKRGGNVRDIPFLLPHFDKKTQIVEIHLITDYKNITISSGNAYTTVQSVAFSDFPNAASIDDLFDECRPIRGRVYYIPRYTVSTTGAIHTVGGAAIDYVDSGVFGSSGAMLDHDNHVLFPLYSTFGTQKGGRRNPISTGNWLIEFDGTPDKNWEITTNTTAKCYWKPYFAAGDVTTSATVGYLVFELDWQLRGMK